MREEWCNNERKNFNKVSQCGASPSCKTSPSGSDKVKLIIILQNYNGLETKLPSETSSSSFWCQKEIIYHCNFVFLPIGWFLKIHSQIGDKFRANAPSLFKLIITVKKYEYIFNKP